MDPNPPAGDARSMNKSVTGPSAAWGAAWNTRTITAFLASPLCGWTAFLSYFVWPMLWHRGADRPWIIFGVSGFYLPFYLVHVVISTAIFLVIRRLAGWWWWSSISGAFAAGGLMLLSFPSAIIGPVGIEGDALIAAAGGMLVHGVCFWVIVRGPPSNLRLQP